MKFIYKLHSMPKKIILTLIVIGIHFCTAQVKWINAHLFEQKNFIENKGQYDQTQLPNKEPILYVAKIDGVIWYFTKNGYSINRIENVKNKDVEEGEDQSKEDENDAKKFIRTSKFQEVKFENANANPEVVAENKVSNYYSFSDLKSAGGKGTIIAFAYKRITYKNIYPNTDIVFEFPNDSTGIEYSIYLHAGADVNNIKIAYPKNKGVDLKNNTIEITSRFGVITEHQPKSFVAGSKEMVKTNFKVFLNKVSFELGNYDHSKTLIIDPWVATPNFGGGNSGAYDVDYDNLGNVYVYGGVGPFECLKYTPAGVLVWSYTATVFGTIYYYGDFAVDRNSNNIYITEGFNNGSGSNVVKINSNAIQQATFGGNAQFREMWRIAFSHCTNQAVIAGGGTTNPTYQTCFLDTGLVALAPIQYIVTTQCCHDVGLLALDNYGFCYQLTNQRSGDSIFDNSLVKLPLPALLPMIYQQNAHYAFREAASVQYYSGGGASTANGYNGLTTSGQFVFSYDGYVLKKWQASTGALLVYQRISWPPNNDSTAMDWGGISADDCGNLFLGDNTFVRQYDANLSLVNSYPMTGVVTDVNIANSGILYVSGLGYVATVQPTNIVNCQNSGVLSLTATSIPATCTTPGSATAVVTGGNPPYNLVWNTIPPQFGLTITGVPAGTYTATIMDGGCLQQTFVDSVTVGSVGGVTASSVSTIATCGNNNGTATVTILTGQTPYQYLWSDGQTTATAVGLAVGTYTCTITDGQGCTTTQIVSITSNNGITATYTSTPTGCTTSTGTATVTGAGGQAPYTYLWSNGQTTQTGTGFPVGSFSCVVTDNIGCSFLLFVNIIANNPLTLSISSTPTGCTTNIGTATAITGNGALPYIYNWSNGQSNVTATGLGLVPISCLVTDNNGCTITQSTTIISNNPIGITFTQTPTGCTVNNGTATVNPTNGTLPYIFSWTNGQSTQTATGLAIGSYTCTVTDSNGCVVTQPFNIVSTNPVVLALSSTVTGCTVNNGTATANASFGALPYTYIWTGGQTTQIATGLAAGSYTCTATDANGCGQTQSVIVTSLNAVTLALSMTPTNCTGNTGTATANPANGALPFTYLWSNGQTSQTAVGLDTGAYYCTVTDALGCARMDTITVTSVNPVTISGTTSQTICTAFTGTATANPANGAVPYTYLWVPGGQTTQTATGLQTGGYFVTTTDANGCSASWSCTITQTPPPTAVAIPLMSAIVSGQNELIQASGGTTYLWSPPEGLACPTCASTLATPSNTMSYCVLVKDANGCADSTCIQIDVLCNIGLLDMLVPTAFSPNHDGMNDELCIPLNVCIIDFEFNIFDRWGEKVFSSTSIANCWDGTYKGADLGTAGFVYSFIARLSNGQDFKQKGTISLIK